MYRKGAIRSQLAVVLLAAFLSACGWFQGSAPPAEGAEVGNGLSADYFQSTNLSGEHVSQIDPQVAFFWGKLPPVPGLRPGGFSARWSGFILPKFAEDYSFFVGAGGRAKLWVGERELDDGASVRLEAGRKVAVRLEFTPTGPDPTVRLEWASPSQAREVIPATRLFPQQQSPLRSQGVALQPRGIVVSSDPGALSVPSGQNLLTNSDFESGTGGWSAALTLVNPGQNGAGSASKLINFGFLQQNLPYSLVEGGYNYTLEAWVKGTGCTVGFKGNRFQGQEYKTELTYTNSAWEYKKTSIVVPDNAAWGGVYLASGATECQYDNVLLSVSQPAAPPATPTSTKLTNGDFENNGTGWDQSLGAITVVTGRTSAKAAQITNWAWVQQILSASTFGTFSGQSYTLKVWGKALNSATCTVGFNVVNNAGVITNKTITFKDATWSEGGTVQVLPSDLSYVGIYLTNNTPECQFDDMMLGPTVAGSESGQPLVNVSTPVAATGAQVLFDATATGENIKYITWNFGDGFDGLGPSISHKYANPGRYIVGTTVTDSNGNVRTTQQTVTILPTVAAMVQTPANAGSFKPVFDAGVPVPGFSYTWDFGNGTSGTGSRTSPTYTQLGTYNVKLTVRDERVSAQGVSAQAVPPIVYEATSFHTVWRRAPVAKFSVTTPKGTDTPVGNVPFTATFNASASSDPNADNTALTYAWDFGDGTTASGVSASKNYSAVGVYLVKLTVTNSFGLSTQYRTFVHARDTRSNLTINAEYPTIVAGASVASLDSVPSPYRGASGGVSAQAVDTVDETYPYVVYSANNFKTGVFRPLTPGGVNTTSLCSSFVAYLNGTVRPATLNNPAGDNLICDFMLITAGTFGLLPVRQNNILISTSQYLANTDVRVIGGLRVPKVYVVVTPDSLLPGNVASPYLLENTALNPQTGKNEFMLTVRVRQSEVNAGKVSFRVPVYAVDASGGFISTANGFFRAKFATTSIDSDCGDCVMVNGKAYINVSLTAANFGPASTGFDLTQITTWGGNPNCGSDASAFGTAFKHRLAGCASFTASYEVPTANAPADVFAFPYDLTLARTFFGRVVYGTTAQQVAQWQDWMKEGVYEDFKEFAIGMIPIYGSGRACFQMLNAYLNWGVPLNLQGGIVTGLACTGFGLEAGGAGLATTQVIRDLMKTYRTSKAANGSIAKVIENQVKTSVATATDETAMRQALVGKMGADVEGYSVCAADCISALDTKIQNKVNAGSTLDNAFTEVKNAYKGCKFVSGVVPSGMVSAQAAGADDRECLSFDSTIGFKLVAPSARGTDFADKALDLTQRLRTASNNSTAVMKYTTIAVFELDSIGSGKFAVVAYTPEAGMNFLDSIISSRLPGAEVYWSPAVPNVAGDAILHAEQAGYFGLASTTTPIGSRAFIPIPALKARIPVDPSGKRVMAIGNTSGPCTGTAGACRNKFLATGEAVEIAFPKANAAP